MCRFFYGKISNHPTIPPTNPDEIGRFLNPGAYTTLLELVVKATAIEAEKETPLKLVILRILFREKVVQLNLAIPDPRVTEIQQQ